MKKRIETWSVVLTANDEPETLEEHLRQFLTQQCDRQVEFIVVNDATATSTDDVLKLLKAEFPQLYTTYIPEAPIHPYRRRLALTIGVKAAKGDWVVMADTSRPPRSEEALQGLMEAADEYGCEAVTASGGRKAADTSTSYRTWTEADSFYTMLLVEERRPHHAAAPGQHQRLRRSRYDMVAVPRNRAQEALCRFDEDIRGSRLLELRIKKMFG